MDEKKFTTEEEKRFEEGVYQTGSTSPPKNHGGLIAFLLVAVIFLSGVSTALGLLNIRLFRQMSDQPQSDAAPVSFSQVADAQEAADGAGSVTGFPGLGITGQGLSSFYQVYYHLPQGIYITEVLDGSDAAVKGILPGDVLVSFNGEAVPSEAALQAMLLACTPGDTAQVTVYRAEKRHTIEIKID